MVVHEETNMFAVFRPTPRPATAAVLRSRGQDRQRWRRNKQRRLQQQQLGTIITIKRLGEGGGTRRFQRVERSVSRASKASTCTRVIGLLKSCLFRDGSSEARNRDRWRRRWKTTKKATEMNSISAERREKLQIRPNSN